MEFSLRNTAKTSIFLAERAVLKFKFIELTLNFLFLLGSRGLPDSQSINCAFSGWLKVGLRLKLGVASHIDSWRTVIESLCQILAFRSHASNRGTITSQGSFCPNFVHNSHFFPALALWVRDSLCCFLKVLLDLVADFRGTARGIFGLLCTSSWLVVLLQFKWLDIHDLWLLPETLELLP